MTARPDILITGLGVVSPLGVGCEKLWAGLVENRSGVSIRPEFTETDWPFRLAARVNDFDPRLLVKPRKALKVMCSPIQQGCAAANLAVEQAGLLNSHFNPDRFATVFGTEIFLADPSEMRDAFSKCIDGGQYQHAHWGTAGISQIEPLWMLKYLPNMVASHISIALDARGPSNSICQGDASSLLAIIEAAELLNRGWADLAVAGGTGSNIQLTSMLYRGAERLSRRIHEPEGASRPFDRERDGEVAGEGAAAIVLETADHAQRRGAAAWGLLSGWARGFCPPENSNFASRLADLAAAAITHAGLSPREIGQVNAQAAGHRQADAREAAAIARDLSHAAVFAAKHNFGNLGPGSGTVELIAGIHALRDNLVPGAINYQTPDPAAPVNLCRENRVHPHEHLLKLSFSTTGQIAAIVVSKC